MDSIQEYLKARIRIAELEKWYVLDEVLQAELDDLISKSNNFKEKLLNFD